MNSSSGNKINLHPQAVEHCHVVTFQVVTLHLHYKRKRSRMLWWERLVNDEKKKTIHDQLDQNTDVEDVHYRLIAHIYEQNLARKKYLKNIHFGEPIWDFLLDLMVSEHLDRPSSIQDISQRLGISENLCNRCVSYLLERSAIFENRNKYSVMQFPWLVSEEVKLKIRQWLDACIKEAPLS